MYLARRLRFPPRSSAVLSDTWIRRSSGLQLTGSVSDGDLIGVNGELADPWSA